MHAKYLILGAGPTGLGAGNRLSELSEKSFLVLEKNPHVGGLAASFKDAHGFTWDIGGHVLFSHYEYFDRLLAEVLGQDFLEHRREAWIRAAGTWVPYPFQNNIRYLPPKKQWECVRGLLAGHDRERTEPAVPANFQEWIDRVFGLGIASLFMHPYNRKVWAVPLTQMSYQWIGERVSVVDLERVLKNILLNLDDVSWGPNKTFKFPLYGGTGEIFKRLGKRVSDHILIGQEAVRVDQVKKSVRLANKETITYDFLLNTGPLDLLVLSMLENAPEPVCRAAEDLTHNSVMIAGVGVKGAKPDKKCWMYFPENDCPFYRVTNFHNYSPKNTPSPDRFRALMTETAFSRHAPVNQDTLMEETIDGLVNVSLLEDGEREQIVSRWERRVDYAYPVPCLKRDSALATIQPYLEAADIYSRGRFGGWKYEVGNMDHSLMQGVEWAEMMVQGKAEQIYTL